MSIPSDFRDQLGSLFQISDFPPFTRIRTPFLYPDGDVLDVFVKTSNGLVIVTDLGGTLGWLWTQNPTNLTPKQQELVADVCKTHGVERLGGLGGMLYTQGQSLADAVMRVAQASMRVSDLWFSFRVEQEKEHD